jgi:pyruvate-ferredoxin/flavodoxin oxidoreductase
VRNISLKHKNNKTHNNKRSFMPNFSNSALRLFQGFFSNNQSSKSEIKTVLDGNSAVAAIETCLAEAAGLGASFPVNTTAWQTEAKNCFGKALISRESKDARGALAAAIGLSMSGTRATAFLSSPDLMKVQDLLVTAVGRHLPLVLHLSNRTIAGHAGALGSGHKAYYLSADSGFFMLHAINVQEAVDLSLIARRVAELTLIPGLVAMDGEQTALAAQELSLPHPDLVRKFVGEPDELITAPTPAQKFLFGETRRRVPRWHDPDRAVMHGALQGSETWALGSVAKHPYFTHHLGEILDAAFAELSEQTGRNLGSISTYKMDNAQIVLVAQGATVEILENIADYMREKRNLKVGVLGIRCLRPFPAALIAKHLHKKRIVAVLERADTPLATDPPLMRQVRAALERALENGRLGGIHPDYPAIKDKALPRFRSVVYGLGGYPLRSADLIKLCEDLEEKGKGRIFLGIEFARASSIYPKRQVLLDSLRRNYPHINELGLKSEIACPDLRPAGALTVAIHQMSEQGEKGLATEAAVLLQHLKGGSIRSLPKLLQERWASGWLDIFTYAPEKLRQLGDDLTIDVTVLTEPLRLTQAIGKLRKGGIMLAVSTLDEEIFWQSLSPIVREELQIQKIRLFLINTSILGGLFATLAELLDIKPRRILSSYEDSLPETERTERLQTFQTGLESIHEIKTTVKTSKLTGFLGKTDEVPLAVRHLAHNRDTYDSLPRFWDQVGVLYRNGETNEMMPNPYLAMGIIPPLSSTFRDLSGAREMLPIFDPNTCTGCGQCWIRCPDSAMASLVISPKILIDAGIKLAKADSLRMAASKLTKRIHSLAREPEKCFNTAGELIQAAFSEFKDKLPEQVPAAIEAVIQKIGELPIARTQPFFYDSEHYQYDTGELFSLVINPDACKACGLCVDACKEGALSRVPQTQENLQQTRLTWRLWEQLPDTNGQSVEHAREKIGNMPAILLSRHCQLSLAGGDNSEAGSGEKLAVRLALAVTEYHQQPLMSDFLKQIVTTRKQIITHIRESIAQALPTEVLTDNLSGINDLLDNTQDLIESSHLRHLVKLSQGLTKLEWQLSEGEQGLGRARFSLAIAGKRLTTWAGTWPHNPFQVPVAIDMNGETAQLASGLLAGQLRIAIEGITLLRQAKQALEQPTIPIAQKPISLEWQALTKEEQEFCSPLLVLGNEEIFGGIKHLLNTNLPLKVIILSDSETNEIGLTALLQSSNAYIVQTSLANTEHFMKNIKAALNYSGPALIHIHAPNPESNGFATDQTITQAKHALKSHTFPLFSYDPNRQGVFGSRISIEGNPEDEGNNTNTSSWHILQELAGVVTPFTKNVEAKLKQEIAEKHEAELAAIKQDYETKIENLQAEMELEMAERVKNKLMNLAGYN